MKNRSHYPYFSNKEKSLRRVRQISPNFRARWQILMGGITPVCDLCRNPNDLGIISYFKIWENRVAKKLDKNYKSSK